MKRPLRLESIPGKNLRSHPVRTVLLLLLTLAQTLCIFGGLTLIRSMREEMTRAEGRLGADILLYPSAAMSRISGDKLLMQGTPVEIWKDRSMLSRLRDCDGIEQSSCQLYLRDTTGETPFRIVGYDPETDFVIGPWLKEEKNMLPAEGTVLIGNAVSADDGTVTLFGRSWIVSGRLEKTDSELDTMVFTGLSTLQDMLDAAKNAGITDYQSMDPKRDFSVALIRVREKKNIDSITNWLNVYMRKMKAVRSEETLSEAAAGIRGQMGLTAGIAGAAWLILLLSLGIVQNMMMKERRKELYVWHTVGASRTIIKKVMVKEAFLVHGTGAILGIPAGILLAHLIPGASFSFPCALLTAVLSILTGCLGMMLVVKRAASAVNGQMLLNI